MKLTTSPLLSVEQTIAKMFELIATTNQDVAQYASMSPTDFYNKVRAIPYKADPKGNEFIQRPSVTLSQASPYGDCDDKAIAMASYARVAGIPYRIVIAGSKAVKDAKGRVRYPFHHVFPEFFMGGKWVPMDATYPRYSPGVHNQNYKNTRIYYPPDKPGYSNLG